MGELEAFGAEEPPPLHSRRTPSSGSRERGLADAPAIIRARPTPVSNVSKIPNLLCLRVNLLVEGLLAAVLDLCTTCLEVEPFDMVASVTQPV